MRLHSFYGRPADQLTDLEVRRAFWLNEGMLEAQFEEKRRAQQLAVRGRVREADDGAGMRGRVVGRRDKERR